MQAGILWPYTALFSDPRVLPNGFKEIVTRPWTIVVLVSVYACQMDAQDHVYGLDNINIMTSAFRSINQVITVSLFRSTGYFDYPSILHCASGAGGEY
jgi:hypothetical protein